MCTIDMLRIHLVRTEAPLVRLWLRQHGIGWAIVVPTSDAHVIRGLYASEDGANRYLERHGAQASLVRLADMTDEQLVVSLAGVHMKLSEPQQQEECAIHAA